ncbi:hypothetical protein Ple7327_1824 [Pleurocapsa sp. PCC 7327]|nr:hypothetical protein Ple7327_1824 [Pleurocapsa sp. PCC 7327]
MSIRSYTRSTDCHDESRRQNITTGVDVSIVGSPTFRTRPLSDAQRQLINYKTAVPTPFTRWEKAVNLYQFSTIPLAFIFELSNQFTPPRITNAACKRTVFNHIGHSQILNRNHLVFAYQLSCQLMQKILSRISNFSLNSSHSNSCFLSILRTFLSSRKSLLCCSKFSVFVVEMLGVGNFFPVAGSNQASQTSIQTNIFNSWVQWLHCWVINQTLTKKETNQRPEGSSLTVTVDGSQLTGKYLLQTIFKGSLHLANHSLPSLYLKADLVNSIEPP